MVSVPSAPGWRPKPQYIATPKPERYRDCGVLPAAQPGGPVDRQHDAQEDAGVARLQVGQRAEEAAVLAAQVARSGQVQPVHGATGVRDREVRHPHQQAHVACLVHRPLRERPVAQVVADQDLLGDQPGQPGDRPGEPLPRPFAGPGEHALQVLRLVRQIPLDRQLAGRDSRDQPGQLPGHQILERPLGDRVVGGEVGLEPVQRAGREGQPDLEAETGRDHPFGAQRAEYLVAGDRVVDARPGIPAQRGDAGPDAEHRGLVGVPRDPGRRFRLLHHDNVRVRPDKALPLVADPGRPGTRLAVRQREYQAVVERGGGAQRRLGRLGRQAPDQQQLTVHPRRHRRLPSSGVIPLDPRRLESCRAVASLGSRHFSIARTRSYGVDVPAMQLERHGWDIHAVSAEPGR